MAKTSAAKATNPATSAPPAGAKSASTDGYQNAEQRFEVSGFWRPELGPIHGLVVGAYEFVQKTGRGKGQTRRVFVLRLAAPCKARVKLEGGGYDEADLEKGEFCGVFYSAGLRELNTLLGCLVMASRNAEKKETTRGAMWTFDVRYKGLRKPVVVRPAFESAPAVPDDDATSFDPDSFSDAF